MALMVYSSGITKEFGMTTTTVKFSVPLKITSEQIDDILTDAFEGGSTHWINRIRVFEKNFFDADYASEVVSRGGGVWLQYDNGDGNLEVLLTREKFLKGLAMAIGRGFNLEDYDGNDVDMVVQYAVFGELVYG
jgi:hypothetical protein